MERNNRGFTLVEMLIVMTVFIVVIMITGDAFNKILTQTNKLSGIEESNIEGVVGLEIFRHDLEQAGYGLPYVYDTVPPNYIEATSDVPKLLNDAPNGLPRAFAFQKYSTTVDDAGATYNGVKGSWYLAVKGVSLSRAAGAQKWTYATYSSNSYGSKPPKIWPSENFASGDRVIVLKRTFFEKSYSNSLAYDTGAPGTYWTTYNKDGFTPAFSPRNANEMVYAYGLGQTNDTSVASKYPTSCAPNTGILYKASVNQSDGKLNYMPLLDCVADMQVVMGWDLWNASSSSEGQDGIIDTWSSPSDASGAITVMGAASQTIVKNALLSPESIRKSLKILKVYVLAQNGKKDSSYTSIQKLNVAGKGELSLGREYSLTPDMINYRWKVYSIVTHPKNLLINQ